MRNASNLVYPAHPPKRPFQQPDADMGNYLGADVEGQLADAKATGRTDAQLREEALGAGAYTAPPMPKDVAGRAMRRGWRDQLRVRPKRSDKDPLGLGFSDVPTSDEDPSKQQAQEVRLKTSRRRKPRGPQKIAERQGRGQ